jgi:hypothetical protein
MINNLIAEQRMSNSSEDEDAVLNVQRSVKLKSAAQFNPNG